MNSSTLFFLILGSVFFILLDELIMGSAQRRIGPFNLGGYGLLSSIINGCNLIISQFLVPKVYFYFGFEFFPIFFFVFSIQNYILFYPFFLVDIYISVIIVVWLIGFCIVWIIFSSLCSCSKYSMLGCIRLISQLLSFELIWTTIIFVFIFSWNELCISVYWCLVLLWLLFLFSFFNSFSLIGSIYSSFFLNSLNLFYFNLILFILYTLLYISLCFKWLLYSLIYSSIFNLFGFIIFFFFFFTLSLLIFGFILFSALYLAFIYWFYYIFDAVFISALFLPSGAFWLVIIFLFVLFGLLICFINSFYSLLLLGFISKKSLFNLGGYGLFNWAQNAFYLLSTRFALFSIATCWYAIFSYFLWFVLNNYFFIFIFILCILGESNRVPFDLPEAESELVAGFITEYSAVIFSLILFTEYTNIIFMFFLLILFLGINSDCLVFSLIIICLIRSTLNRLKFDELLTNCWIVILPFIFALLILFLS